MHPLFKREFVEVYFWLALADVGCPRSYSCEQRRISDFYNEPSICGKTMVVIRWNPDGYKPEAGRAKVELKERLRLFVMLKKALRGVKALPKIVVFYMFYSRANSCITIDLPHYHVDSEADIVFK